MNPHDHIILVSLDSRNISRRPRQARPIRLFLDVSSGVSLDDVSLESRHARVSRRHLSRPEAGENSSRSLRTMSTS